MRIPRVFHPEPIRCGDTVPLSPGATRHVRSVLRLGPGQQVELFDGQGTACLGQIQAGRGAGVHVLLQTELSEDREAALTVVLGLGISKGERMDLAIQKAVELGVHAIHPLVTQRTVVRLDPERARKRLAHWEGIVRSACEQCGRNRLAGIAPAQPLDRWLSDMNGQMLSLMPTPGAERGLGELSPPDGLGVRLLIGPEGGLDEAERRMAESVGFVPVRLGPRILRTETAAMTALAAVMTLWGDLA